jgi:hypothetical protein
MWTLKVRYLLGVKSELLLQQQGVGAEIDVFLALHEAGDDLVDFRMQQRLAAGDADHGRAAFLDGVEALLAGSDCFFRTWAGY